MFECSQCRCQFNDVISFPHYNGSTLNVCSLCYENIDKKLIEIPFNINFKKLKKLTLLKLNLKYRQKTT